MMTGTRSPAGRIRVTSSSHFVALMVLTILMGLISVACTPTDVHTAAARLGVTVTDEQAQAISADHNAKPEVILAVAQTNPMAITPELAKAIAWTAMVVEQQRAAALPCRNSVCPTAAQWAKLRTCEGGHGNPYLAVNHSGKYRGAYQMDRSFWLSYGGDPDYSSPPRWEHAPPAMQDRVAFAGYRERGSNPWPYCGRHLR